MSIVSGSPVTQMISPGEVCGTLTVASLGANRYYRGEGYVETDMDTGSSAAAASLCGRCRGQSRKINVELGIVLQASDNAVQQSQCPRHQRIEFVCVLLVWRIFYYHVASRPIAEEKRAVRRILASQTPNTHESYHYITDCPNADQCSLEAASGDVTQNDKYPRHTM